MQVLSDKEAEDWCVTKSIRAEDRRILGFHLAPKQCLRIETPDSFFDRVMLVYRLLSYPEEESFSGMLVWFKDWNIWTPQVEQAGLEIAKRMRLGFGLSKPLAEASAHLFESDEFTAAYALAVLPIAFDWDAYLVPGDRRHFSLIHHDGVTWVTPKDEAEFDHLCKHLDYWKPERIEVASPN